MFGNPFLAKQRGSILHMVVPVGKGTYTAADWPMAAAVEALLDDSPVLQVELEDQGCDVTVFIPKTLLLLSMTNDKLMC